MPARRTTKKKTPRLSQEIPASAQKVSYVRFISVGFAVVILLFVVALAAKAYHGSYVLSAKTFLLADRGPGGGSGEDSGRHHGENEVNQRSVSESHGAAGSLQQLPSQGAPIIRESGEDEVRSHTENHDGVENETSAGQQMHPDINPLGKGQGGTASIGTISADEQIIRQGSVAAHTRFPLSIDPQTGALTVTTPAGQKTVTVLPQQALKQLMQHKIIDRLQITSEGSTSGSLNLTLFDNKPAFEVQGIDDKKLFGIIPVSIPKTSFVSAENGEVMKTTQSFVSHILSAFSF